MPSAQSLEFKINFETPLTGLDGLALFVRLQINAAELYAKNAPGENSSFQEKASSYWSSLLEPIEYEGKRANPIGLLLYQIMGEETVRTKVAGILKEVQDNEVSLRQTGAIASGQSSVDYALNRFAEHVLPAVAGECHLGPIEYLNELTHQTLLKALSEFGHTQVQMFV